jgi:hypothetical protein
VREADAHVPVWPAVAEAHAEVPYAAVAGAGATQQLTAVGVAAGQARRAEPRHYSP